MRTKYRVAIGAVIIIAAIVLMAILTNVDWGALKNEVSTEETASEEVGLLQDEKELKEQAENIQKILSLSDAEFQSILERSGLNGAVLNRNSLPAAKVNRLFEDGVSIPLNFEGKNANEVKEELMDELRNPIWLAARFERLSEINLKDGTKLSEYYPALEAYVKLFNEHGVEYFVEEQDANGNFPLTTEYLKYAVIGELLFDSTDARIQKDVTTDYVWRLSEEGVYQADGSFDLSKIKAVKKAYVEDDKYNDILVVIHRIKSTGGVLYEEYFDLYDRAPLTKAPEKPTVVEPTTKPETKPEDEPGTGGDDPEPDKPEDEPGTGGDDPGHHDPDTHDKKDPDKGTKGDLAAPNDDSGPGEDTNTGKGSKESSEDEDTSSNHLTYDEYEQKIEEIEEAQESAKKAEEDNQKAEEKPAEKPTDKPKVDDNGDKGTGNGGADTKTPVDEKPTEIEDDQPAGSWGGPPD